jgi:ribonuclease BN (tRNA processing enzyme)
MKIYPLGTGTGLSTKVNNTNLVIELGDTKILVDAGITLGKAMEESKFEPTDIDYILISHFHADHAGGLENFLQKCKFEHNHIPSLIVKREQYPMLKNLLSTGIDGINGFKIEDYCDLFIIDGQSFSIPAKSIADNNLKVEYIDTSNFHCLNMVSFGFDFVEINNLSHETVDRVIYTSDIKDLNGLTVDVKSADEDVRAVIVDCSFKENPVHASLDDILHYFPIDSYRKIWLIHYPDVVEQSYIDKAYDHGLGIAQTGLYIG